MDNEDLAHRSVRSQDAQAMYHQGQFGQRRDAAVKPSMRKENVEFGRATSISFLMVHRRRPLRKPIFLVCFVILDFGLWTSALWRSV